MGLTMFVIIKGVKGGIEKWTKIMMPAILVILFLLMVRGLTLPNGAKRLPFYSNQNLMILLPRALS